MLALSLAIAGLLPACDLITALCTAVITVCCSAVTVGSSAPMTAKYRSRSASGMFMPRRGAKSSPTALFFAVPLASRSLARAACSFAHAKWF